MKSATSIRQAMCGLVKAICNSKKQAIRDDGLLAFATLLWVIEDDVASGDNQSESAVKFCQQWRDTMNELEKTPDTVSAEVKS